jgi:hypothetical protein
MSLRLVVLRRHILPREKFTLSRDRVDERIITMTQAVPGEEGCYHVNCQSAKYQVKLMSSRGITLSERAGNQRGLLQETLSWNSLTTIAGSSSDLESAGIILSF